MGSSVNPYQTPKQADSAGRGIGHPILTAFAYSGSAAPLVFSVFVIVCRRIVEAGHSVSYLILVLAFVAYLAWWFLALLVSILYLFSKNSRSTGVRAVVVDVFSMLLAQIYIL
jgi:hypothetical protein